MADSD
jgi:hypothetical protein